MTSAATEGQRKDKHGISFSTHSGATSPSSSYLQVQPLDALEPEFTKKYQSLLQRWREKVFALTVQLKAQEIEHRDHMKQLKGQVSDSV